MGPCAGLWEGFVLALKHAQCYIFRLLNACTDYVAKVKVDWSGAVLERNRQMMERLLDVDPTSYDPNVPKPDTANENYLHWLLDEGTSGVVPL